MKRLSEELEFDGTNHLTTIQYERLQAIEDSNTELLEALKEAKRWVGINSNDERERQGAVIINEAIKKAEGK